VQDRLERQDGLNLFDIQPVGVYSPYPSHRKLFPSFTQIYNQSRLGFFTSFVPTEN
jgi:hypothetical protein